MNLFKTFMALCVAASVFSCTAGAPAYGQQSSQGVVIVESDIGKGTGTYIGGGRFLTAAHVVAGTERGVLTDFRGAKVPYVVVIISTTHDVAVLETQEPITLPERSIDCRVPAIGEDVEFIGHPLRWDYVHGWGRVASRSIEVPGFLASGVWIASPVGAGQSGSAVLDKNGRIVGIVTAGMQDAGSFTGYMLATTGRAICGVLSIS